MLKTYKELADKDGVFASHVIVNSKSELDYCLKDLETKQKHRKERFLFRGHNEAAFKLYTSSQRFWDYRDLAITGINYTEAIVKMIKTLKDGPLHDYYKRLGVIQNDWLYLSFLQHYGAPSPLLDFSRRYDVALFFAFDEVCFSGKTEIDNYVSMYYYRTVEAANGYSCSVIKLAEKAAENKLTMQGKQFWDDLSYPKIIAENETVIVPAYSRTSAIKNKNKEQVSIYSIANLNSTAQEGEFVCNGSSDKPLEEIWIRNSKACLHCIDIHKALYEYVLKDVLKSTIEEARRKYYPTERDLAYNTQMTLLSEL